MESIHIVSDGSASGTRVYNHDGAEIKGIISVTINPIRKDFVTATIEFANVKLGVVAEVKNG